MKRACEAMLLLYPPLHRARYGQEMAAVFEEAAGDQKMRGALMYRAFLCHEFVGILTGAFTMWIDAFAARARRGVSGAVVASAFGGIIIAALWQGIIFGGFAGLGKPLILMPDGPQAAVTSDVPFILAAACLLLISVFSAAFVWNLRNIGNRAEIRKPIRMPGRSADARITKRH